MKEIDHPMTLHFLLSVFSFIFLFTLFITVQALSATSPLVEEGRALLFNNAHPTYSGILAAHEKFEAAVAEDFDDPNANFFLALTRILAFGLENGDTQGIDTCKELLESFGITRTSEEEIEDGHPYTDLPTLGGKPDLPHTTPGGSDIRTFFSGPFINLINATLDNLNKITDTFMITLSETEIDDVPIEIDYGDILLFKSMLNALKSMTHIITAYNLDVNIRELAALANADNFSIERDLLSKYQDLLKLIPETATPTGAQSLDDAKIALLDGIASFELALDFIENEKDAQENDLFYFESNSDIREARNLLLELVEVRNSLNDNRPAVFKYAEETWIFTDDNNRQIQVEIERDRNGNFFEGYFNGLNGCDFVDCYGDVDSWVEKDSTITIIVVGEGWHSSYATLTGTLQAGNSINGTFTTNLNESGNFEGLCHYTESGMERIDFNHFFGGTGKDPLNIREALPGFDQYNGIIPGTFPPTDDSSPVLNGIFPDLPHNSDLTREMELEPSGSFNIPMISITIDGDFSDWSSDTLVFTDIQGDEDEEADFTGMDLHSVYLAQDSNNYYFRMTFYDGMGIETDGMDFKTGRASPSYYFKACSSTDESPPGDYFCGVDPVTLNVWVLETPWDPYMPSGPRLSFSGNAARDTKGDNNSIEWKVLKVDMGTFAGKYVEVWTHMIAEPNTYKYEVSDYNHTKIKLDVASASGTLDYSSSPSPSGNVFLWAYDGPNPDSATVLGAALANPDRTYTLPDLPIGSNVYLFAHWDADGNGMRSVGDYLGNCGPYHITAEGLSGIPIDIDYEITFESALDKGIQWLRDNWNEYVDWGYDINKLMVTELAILALLHNGYGESDPDFIESAIGSILDPNNNGAFTTDGHGSYNSATALGVIVLEAADKYNEPKKYGDAITNAIRYLLDIQNTEVNIYNFDSTNPAYGGWGFGEPDISGAYVRADLSNTQVILSALQRAKNVVEGGTVTRAEIDDGLAKGLIFLQRCQNRPSTNDLFWAHNRDNESYNDGGFIDNPSLTYHDSSPESLDSCTYAGIIGYLTTGIEISDARITDALNWKPYGPLIEWYVEEDLDGYAYYTYCLAAQALGMVGHAAEDIHPAWFTSLSNDLIARQEWDGSWINHSPFYWEPHKALTTAYALCALGTHTISPTAMLDILVTDETDFSGDLCSIPSGSSSALLSVIGPNGTGIEGSHHVSSEDDDFNLLAGSYFIDIEGTSNGYYTLIICGQEGYNTISIGPLTQYIMNGETHRYEIVAGSMGGFALELLNESPESTIPYIEITSPAALYEKADDNYMITWKDGDLDDNATIHLYYDTNMDVSHGWSGEISPPEGIGEDGPNAYVWDTSGLPEGGEYYIYATISDDTNSYSTCSLGTLVISPDGIPKEWEEENGLNIYMPDAHADYDEDNLTNIDEYDNGTDPKIPDTDSDGLPDGFEVEFELDPTSNSEDFEADGDPDGDGLTNIEEYDNSTDPKDFDSDDDGIPDGWDSVWGGFDVNGSIQLIDSGWTDVDSWLDLRIYQPGDIVNIQVIDYDMNTDPNLAETFEVMITSDTEDTGATSSATLPEPGPSNMGNGSIGNVITSYTTLSEDWVVTCMYTDDFNGNAYFQVSSTVGGYHSGAMAGVRYTSNNGEVVFTIAKGDIDFAYGDTFTFTTIEGTPSLETVTVTEIETNSGIYRGSIVFDDAHTPAIGDGDLDITSGDTITVIYDNAVDNFGIRRILVETAFYSAMVIKENITVDTVWTSANSPYLIIGDVTVHKGVTLTIEPGTRIEFQAQGDDQRNEYYNDYLYQYDYYVENDEYFYYEYGGRLIVYGELIAQGTPSNKILFTSIERSPAPGDWQGIVFEGGEGIIEYCHIEYGYSGINLYDSSPYIGSSIISNNYDCGIYCDNSHPIMEKNSILNNYYSGIFCDNSSPTINNNTISHNKYRGIYCYDSSPTINNNIVSYNGDTGILCVFNSSPLICHNSIYYNEDSGIYCNYSSPTINNNAISNNEVMGIFCESDSSPAISHNTISYNKNEGIYCEHDSSPTIHYNNIYDNSYYDIKNFSYNEIDAKNNWWGDLATEQMDLYGYFYDISSIYDSFDDDSGIGLVNYSDWLGEEMLLAPAAFLSSPGNGVISLSWTSVMAATGYTIHYGTSPETYSDSIDIDAGDIIAYSLDGLTNNTQYYIAVTAYATDENETVTVSDYSAQIEAVPTLSGGVLGLISFDKEYYNPGKDTAVITIDDMDLNTDQNSIQNVDIHIISSSDPVGITMTLAETYDNSGIFTTAAYEKDLGFSLENSDDKNELIYVSKGDEVIALYHDLAPSLKRTESAYIKVQGGSVTGIIQNEEGNPIADVSIFLENDCRGLYEETYSTQDGYFTFTDIPEGIIRIAAMPGVHTPYSNNYYAWSEEIFFLSQGEEKKDIIITLKEGALISGHVMDEASNGYSYIDVEAAGENTKGLEFKTDSNGYYEMRLAAGIYGLEIWTDTGGCTALPQKIAIAHPADDQTVNFTAYDHTTGCHIEGILTNEGYAQHYGSEFDIWAVEAGTEITLDTIDTVVGVSEAVFEDSNSYRILVPPNTSYDIYFDSYIEGCDNETSTIRGKISSVSVGEPGDHIQIQDFSYDSEGSTIQGNVTSGGEPILLATIMLFDNNGNFKGLAQSNQHGEYSFFNVPAGSYNIVASAFGYLREEAGEVILTYPSEAVNIDFTLIPDTLPPALTVPPDIFIEAEAICMDVNIGMAEAVDIFHVTLSNNAPGCFSVGATDVTWTATDVNGNSTTDIQRVTIMDTTPPILTVPYDLTVSQELPDGTLASNAQIKAFLEGASASDIGDPSVTITVQPLLEVFPIGETAVTFTATDNSGNQVSDSAILIVESSVLTLTITADSSLLEDDLMYDHHNLVIDGCTLTIQGDHSFSSLTLINGGKITHVPQELQGISLTVEDSIKIDQGSAIVADGLGLSGGRGPNNEDSLYGQSINPDDLTLTQPGSAPQNGGSYGGMGGKGDPSASTNAAYGDLSQPLLPGSGGGGEQGGAGGGIIHIYAFTIELDGSISANGNPGGEMSGAGSGGSILIQAYYLSGTGVIEANGGSNESNTPSGCGGGGRIALYVPNLSLSDTHYRAFGGEHTGGSSEEAVNFNGSAGTIYLHNSILLQPEQTLLRERTRYREGEASSGILIIDNNMVLSSETTPIFISPDQSGLISLRQIIIKDGGSLDIQEGVSIEVTEQISVKGKASLLTQPGSSVQSPAIIVTETSQLSFPDGCTVKTDKLFISEESFMSPESMQNIEIDPLLADFTLEPPSGELPLGVTFVDHSTGYIQDYVWDFGDGESSSLPNPIHMYTKMGTFDVTLTIKGAGDSALKILKSAVEITSPESPSITWPIDEASEEMEIREDVVIFSDEILYIKPGTVVRSHDNVSITIEGALYAIGDAANPILFTASQESWDGMIITSSDTSIQHCQFEKVKGEGYASLTVREASPFIAYTTFRHNAIGLMIQNGGGEYVRNTLIENTQSAFIIDNPMPSGSLRITQNLIAKNPIGISTRAIPSDIIISENNFQAQTLYHFENKSSTDLIIPNNWWGKDLSTDSVNSADEPEVSTRSIDDLIYDQLDDPDCGLIDYGDFLHTPSATAPLPYVCGLQFHITENSDVTLSWDTHPATDIQGYRIYTHNEEAPEDFQFITQLEGGSTVNLDNFTLDSLYGVTAYDIEGHESPLALSPPSPTGLSVIIATDVDEENVKIFWNPLDKNKLLIGYWLYYGTREDLVGSRLDPDTATKVWVDTGSEYFLTLVPDITWYFSVTAYDLLRNQSMYAQDVKGTPSQGLTTSQKTLTGGTAVYHYRMLSVPLQTEIDPLEQLKQQMGAYDPYSWRLFRYNTGQEVNRYVELPQLSELYPGEAVWIIIKADRTIQFSGSSVSTEDNYSITIKSGWNQIGSPFNFPVNWEDIYQLNSDKVENRLYQYTGQESSPYSEAHQLVPTEGYWIKCIRPEQTELLIPPISQKLLLSRMKSSAERANIKPDDFPPLPPLALSQLKSWEDIPRECFLTICSDKDTEWALVSLLPLFLIVLIVLPFLFRSSSFRKWFFLWVVVLLYPFLLVAREAPSILQEGMEAYKEQRYEEALSLFERQISENPDNTTAHFYMGLIYYQQNNIDKAEEEFLTVINLASSPKLSKIAQKYYDRISIMKKKIFISFSASLRYDDNVILAPDSDIHTLESIEDEPADEGDWKNTFLLITKVRPWKKAHNAIDVEYDFYQSVYHKLNNYNIHADIGSVSFKHSEESVSTEAAIAYFRSLVDRRSYLNIWKPHLLFTVKQSKNVEGRCMFTYQWKTFPHLENRDGEKTLAGIEETFFFKNRSQQLHIGYTYGKETCDTNYLSYREHDILLQYDHPTLYQLILSLKGNYTSKDFSGYRYDEKNTFHVSLGKKFDKTFDVRIQYTRIFNDSTEQDKQYHRNIYTISIWKQF
ncbi:MAG: right-handed parallel beta-helix repeat-containing protein [bacterium]